jgi:hypothetical protein
MRTRTSPGPRVPQGPRGPQLKRSFIEFADLKKLPDSVKIFFFGEKLTFQSGSPVVKPNSFNPLFFDFGEKKIVKNSFWKKAKKLPFFDEKFKKSYSSTLKHSNLFNHVLKMTNLADFKVHWHVRLKRSKVALLAKLISNFIWSLLIWVGWLISKLVVSF